MIHCLHSAPGLPLATFGESFDPISAPVLPPAFAPELLSAAKLPEAFAFDSPVSAPVLPPAFAPEPLPAAKLPEAFAFDSPVSAPVLSPAVLQF